MMMGSASKARRVLHIFYSLCTERQAQGLHASRSMHTFAQFADVLTCRPRRRTCEK